MSSPAISPSGDGRDGVERLGMAGDVRELDARDVVEAIVEQRATADRAEARLLALAVHFVDLHPVTPGHRAARWDPDEMLPATSQPRAAGEKSTAPTGRVHLIAGEGTPGVA